VSAGNIARVHAWTSIGGAAVAALALVVALAEAGAEADAAGAATAEAGASGGVPPSRNPGGRGGP
jgi:hypothetical protein